MKLTRRDLLKKSVATLLTGSGAAATLNSLALTNALAQDASDYRSLVCIFLYGGNDSFNMFAPRTGDPYNAYRESRRNLAIDSGSMLGVSPGASDGAQYGFHPAMPEAQQLFSDGKLAVLGNVGPLLVPTTRTDYREDRVPLPSRLFSHNNQQDFWQSLNPDVGQPTGWAGRMADALASINTNQQLSMNVSMTGTNLMQTGRAGIPYILSPSGIAKLKSKTRYTSRGRLERRDAAMNTIFSQYPEHVFANEYRKLLLSGQELGNQITDVLDAAPAQTTIFPMSRLGAALQMVARMISVRDQLGLSRQIFFVGFGGWDTHGDQDTRHPVLLSELSQAMSAFYRSTEEIGIADKVTAFTAADFGRTLTSNGDGSDHGWGGNQLIMGGAVSGNNIYGQMPDYQIEGNSDSGRGRIIPTTAVDQFGATLARWFGLSESNLSEVFPNLSNFNDRDVGFFRQG